MNRKALGRGLGALLSSDLAVAVAEDPYEIDIATVDAGRLQPRTHFEEGSLQNLAESIKTHGVVQPILVRRIGERYELIAGERRWRAALMAGLTKIPAVIKDVPDDQALEIALIENVQREDLNPIEEAHAYQKLIETVGLTQDALAARVGRDRSYITNYLRLLRLPDDLQKLVVERKLSTGHARTLLALPHVDQQRRLARQIIERDLSVRMTELLVKRSGEEKSGPPAAPVAMDPNIRAAESKLRRLLGTQVRIIQKGAEGRGTLEISFFSIDDLNRIYDLITSRF
ncbi:MAG: ParB/RepB/Spo0J family partition protein [Pyrinomonadaceae bacterium]